jgi:hypothetical protein
MTTVKIKANVKIVLLNIVGLSRLLDKIHLVTANFPNWITAISFIIYLQAKIANHKAHFLNACSQEGGMTCI